MCDFLNSYIVSTETITVSANNTVIFKNYALLTTDVTEIKDSRADEASEFEETMIIMFVLIEYSDNYSKTSGNLLKYHRSEATDENDVSLAPKAADSEYLKHICRKF